MAVRASWRVYINTVEILTLEVTPVIFSLA
jgi:hypothetical protein